MTRAARTRVLVGHALALAAAVVSACGDTTDPNAVPGRRSGRGVGEDPGAAPPPAPAPPPPGHDGLTDRERRRRDRRAPRAPGTAAGGGGGATADEGALAEAEEGPDVRGMLERAFGTPTQCLSEETRDALDDSLQVTVTARVLPSGRVLDAEVSGGGLSDVDRACMRRHARGMRLRSDLPGTPRSVTATIIYAVRDDRVTRTERTVPDRGLHPGTLDPDSTLPAAGTAEGRPAGSVTPDHTLPAVGSDERPPGFVPPSSTLPARGD